MTVQQRLSYDPSLNSTAADHQLSGLLFSYIHYNLHSLLYITSIFNHTNFKLSSCGSSVGSVLNVLLLFIN